MRIEHPTSDFDAWKRAFDSDPVSRAQGGVRRYRVMRPYDDRSYAMIDLEFERAEQAQAFLVELRELWTRVDVMRDPQAKVTELIDSEQLAAFPGAA